MLIHHNTDGQSKVDPHPPPGNAGSLTNITDTCCLKLLLLPLKNPKLVIWKKTEAPAAKSWLDRLVKDSDIIPYLAASPYLSPWRGSSLTTPTTAPTAPVVLHSRFMCTCIFVITFCVCVGGWNNEDEWRSERQLLLSLFETWSQHSSSFSCWDPLWWEINSTKNCENENVQQSSFSSRCIFIRGRALVFDQFGFGFCCLLT